MGRRVKDWYYEWDRYSGLLHVALGITVLGSMLCVFLAKTFNGVAGLGAAAVGVSILGVVGVILGSDVWFPRLPRDVWREAQKDKHFKEHADAMENRANLQDELGFSGGRDSVMDEIIEDALTTYRSNYPAFLARRVLRRAFVFLCVVLTYAAAARGLFLADHHAYGHGFTVHSTVVDYTYFAVISVSTIGFGDITPTSGAARALSIAFAVIAVMYLLMVINYVWMHEARRERLLMEHIDKMFGGQSAVTVTRSSIERLKREAAS